MRRSPTRTDHALQPSEYMEEINALTKDICKQLALEVKIPNDTYAEKQLELILRRLDAITKHVKVTPAKAIPIDVKSAKETAEVKE